MSSDLTLSAPGVFQAMQNLLVAAGEAIDVPVFSFALNQDEPSSYVILTGIENHRLVPRTTGFGFDESYDITGLATVFSGSATPDDPTVTSDVLAQTFSLYQAVVMTPVVTNRQSWPTTGPLPHHVLPRSAEYSASPGSIGGAQGGWAGVITWAYHFDARLLPG